jgi:hypothetical protein
MLRRVVKRDCLIVVHTAPRNVSSVEQGGAHVAMPYHEWNRGALLLSERQEMGSEINTDIAMKFQNVIAITTV